MRTAITTILLFISSITFAQSVQDCFKAAEDQRSMNLCATENIKDANALHEMVLVELKDTLPSEQYSMLLEAEKAWEIVAKKDCAIKEWYLNGGTARGMIVTNCYAAHTRQRVENISSLLCHPMLACNEAEKYQKDYNNKFK